MRDAGPHRVEHQTNKETQMNQLQKILNHHAVQSAYRTFVSAFLGVFLAGLSTAIDGGDIHTQKAALAALLAGSAGAAVRAVIALAVAAHNQPIKTYWPDGDLDKQD